MFVSCSEHHSGIIIKQKKYPFLCDIPLKPHWPLLLLSKEIKIIGRRLFNLCFSKAISYASTFFWSLLSRAVKKDIKHWNTNTISLTFINGAEKSYLNSYFLVNWANLLNEHSHHLEVYFDGYSDLDLDLDSVGLIIDFNLQFSA